MTSKAREKFAEVYLVLRESLSSFLKDRCFEWAATLAYGGFLALIPMLLLAVFVVTHFIASSEEAMDALNDIVGRMLPLSDSLVLNEVSPLSGHKAWGIATVIVLLWCVTPLVSFIRSAFHSIFKSSRKRTFLRSQFLDVLSAAITLLLFVGLIAAKPVYSSLLRVLPVELSPVLHTIEVVAPFLATVIVLVFFYRFFAPERLKFRHILTGCLVTAVLLSAMAPLFALILKYNPDYGLMFGSLKAIFLFFIWVYYAFLAFLFGAEVIAVMGQRESLLLRGLFDDRFTSLRKSYQILLSRLAETFGYGDVVFHEGDTDTAMFFVLRGQVALSAKGQVLKVLNDGEYFGEMAMLLKTPRTMTATITAPETELVVIRDKNFDTVLHENPEVVMAILREMAARLKATNERLL